MRKAWYRSDEPDGVLPGPLTLLATVVVIAAMFGGAAFLLGVAFRFGWRLAG